MWRIRNIGYFADFTYEHGYFKAFTVVETFRKIFLRGKSMRRMDLIRSAFESLDPGASNDWSHTRFEQIFVKLQAFKHPFP